MHLVTTLHTIQVYIAEFFNTISNIGMVVAGSVAVWQCIK